MNRQSTHSFDCEVLTAVLTTITHLDMYACTFYYWFSFTSVLFPYRIHCKKSLAIFPSPTQPGYH
jgi:hypothetical protein